MFNIINRLYRIARANGVDKVQDLREFISRDKQAKDNSGASAYSHTDSDYENRYSTSSNNSSYDYSESDSTWRDTNEFHDNTRSSHSEYPKQVIEDLAVFSLVPPASFEEVRKARNREIKKYHPDKHVNDPKKAETSKQIMQVINAAYDRLEKYYDR